MPTAPVVALTHWAVMAGGLIVIPQLVVVATAAWPGVESVTFTVNEYGPAVVGVPLITPVDAFSVRPAGSEPEASAKVNGAVPPVTVIDEL